jgi:hypothetical protein
VTVTRADDDQPVALLEYRHAALVEPVHLAASHDSEDDLPPGVDVRWGQAEFSTRDVALDDL